MKKTLIYLLPTLLLWLGACSDDIDTTTPTYPEIEESDGNRISSFDVRHILFSLDNYEGARFANLKTGFTTLITCPVNVERKGEILRCGMTLTNKASIPDGTYLLTFSKEDGSPLRGMAKIKIEGEKVVEAEEAVSSFSLRKGSGTEYDPYLIENERDFYIFLDDLRTNELTNGRDVWFKQTADIHLSDQSSLKPGRGYWGFSFAGHYDGGGFRLSDMYYRGAANPESDSRIGLFPTLLDGAYIKNLTISNVNMSDAHSDVGALAGVSVGTVTLNDISVFGNLSGKGDAIGGLIGRHEKGHLSVTGVKYHLNIEGNDNVGGVLGEFDEGILWIAEVSTPDYHFSVTGNNGVGGAVGTIRNGHITIRDIDFRHAVSKEDADIRLIRTKGGEGTGVAAGRITGLSEPALFFNIIAACPVGGIGETGSKIAE